MKTTIIILCFLAGAMIAHALYQPVANDIYRAESVMENYRQSAVVGWVRMDSVTQELYFVDGR